MTVNAVFSLECNPARYQTVTPGGRGGGALRYSGGRTRVTYFAEEGVFLKTACPRFVKEEYYT